MPNKVGINVPRVIVGGKLNQANINLDQARHGNPPQQFRVVVMEVFYDPNELTTEAKQSLKDTVRNPEFVDNMPPNSILGRVVTSGENDAIDAPSIFYPYFQSHLMLPIVAGEHVHVIYEDFEREGTSLGRWITRIHESRAVEDVNYTHADRRFDVSLQPATERTSQTANRNSNQAAAPPPPSFPNGGNTNDSLTLPPSGSNNGNPYEGIYQQAAASKLHTYEPVPRWTKRPDEFVVQGTNNTLIVLGQDRTGPAKRVEDGPDQKRFAGAIDMVVGRGRYPYSTTNPQDTPTSPVFVENTRRLLEVDKTPTLRGKQDNRKEGDPDFTRDAARVLLLMNSEADKNLKTQEGNEGISYPDNTLKPTQPPATGNRFNRSYVVSKADHLRMIARKTRIPTEGNPEVNGTILILREGVKDESLAFLYINPDGLLQLEAKEIYIGKATRKNEPYIKWTKFKEAVDNLQAQLDKITATINAMGRQLNGISRSSVCVPFLPDPAVQGIGAVVGATAQSLNVETEKQAVNRAVTDSKSRKIFGE